MPAWPRWVELEPGKDFTHCKRTGRPKKLLDDADLAALVADECIVPIVETPKLRY